MMAFILTAVTMVTFLQIRLESLHKKCKGKKVVHIHYYQNIFILSPQGQAIAE
jgi:hypothetical protein